MSATHGWKRIFSVIAIFLGVWLCLRYLFPFFLPFLLGLALAVISEPLTKFFSGRLRWRRFPAAGVSVSLILGLLALAVWFGLSALTRRAAAAARSIADTFHQLAAGAQVLREQALSLSARAPAGLSQPLTQAVEELFSDSSPLLDFGADAAMGLAGQAAQQLPGSLVTLGTALLAAYMISARLPELRRRAASLPLWQERCRPVLVRLRRVSTLWLKAQLRLSGVTFLIVLGGFLLLGIRRVLPLAVVTALVDAVPLLGTGTILLPWALVSWLEGVPVRAVGLLSIYVTALLVRSSLEPRLVGSQLGLDPLAALAALYTGYRIWGFPGMILAPILTVTARELCRSD